jgi:orotidine-5'-phosphate decarboxylase
MFLAIARRAEHTWNALGNAMLVVGATSPEDLAKVRRAAPSLPFLVPGIGEQGGSAASVANAGRRADGHGLVVSASRSILYAGGPDQICRAVETARGELDLVTAG